MQDESDELLLPWPKAMQDEFDREIRDLATWYPGDAFEGAGERLGRTWGITRVGGEPRWMKYAPELMYGAPDRREETGVRFDRQLREAIGAELGVDPASLPGSLALDVDPASIAGRDTPGSVLRPRYLVGIDGDSGSTDLRERRPGDGFTWYPDDSAPAADNAGEPPNREPGLRARGYEPELRGVFDQANRRRNQDEFEAKREQARARREQIAIAREEEAKAKRAEQKARREALAADPAEQEKIKKNIERLSEGGLWDEMNDGLRWFRDEHRRQTIGKP